MNMRVFLINAVRKAGEAILAINREDFSAFAKADRSPVTEADFAADAALRQALQGSGIPFISEESADAVSGRTERYWLADPLDGTQDFISGSDDFCTMLALIENGVPTLAAIYLPALDALYVAEQGQGAFIEDGAGKRMLRVSGQKTRTRLIASINHFTPDMETIARKMGSSLMRRGSNGVKAGLIAEGKAEYMFSSWNFFPWDVAAPQLIVEEAGGCVTGISGGTIRYDTPGQRIGDGFAASNGIIHDVLLESLTEVSKHSVS